LAVNCSALPGTLVESMIFGHQRGAFTGADRRVRGQLELAAEGTLLLDEIAEMPIELQAKLLRVLEDRRFRPLGSEVELPVRARILAATHVDLEQRMAQGLFREDLYYRLNVVVVTLPPLREHPLDIDELLRAFNANLLAPLRFTEDALAWLKRRDWPGNVRELKNAVERIALLCESPQVSAADLVEIVGESPRQRSRELERMARAVLALEPGEESKLELIERVVLAQALEVCDGNKSAAARLVGLDRKALERRWSRLSEPPPHNGDV
jgi:DNA-binding NtrC family response regulator